MAGHQRRWRKFYDLNSKARTYNQDLDLHFWRLISNDCLYRITRPPNGEFMIYPLKLFHTWLDCIEASTKILQRSWAHNANFAVVTACTGRQLFCTENGYVGTGPPDLEPGELIYALAGGPYLYVLRPLPNSQKRWTFNLIGDCYVQGLMHGDTLEGRGNKFHDVYLK